MKIFLSALENGASCTDHTPLAYFFVQKGLHMKWNLMSYYYIKNQMRIAEMIRDNSELVMIDSGAHSFQKGVKVNWEQYTKQYAEFIKKFDRKNVVGYFEMDVDNILGYDKVLALRNELEKVSNKIIPVWHKNRGIDEYKKMCKQYANKVIAITGFKNEDIKDEQYLMFLKYAKLYNCKVHCLGMTRRKVLDKVPFDYVDSSSWKQSSLYGRIDNKGQVSKEFSKAKREIVFFENYKQAMLMQEHYNKKWRKYD